MSRVQRCVFLQNSDFYILYPYHFSRNVQQKQIRCYIRQTRKCIFIDSIYILCKTLVIVYIKFQYLIATKQSQLRGLTSSSSSSSLSQIKGYEYLGTPPKATSREKYRRTRWIRAITATIPFTVASRWSEKNNYNIESRTDSVAYIYNIKNIIYTHSILWYIYVGIALAVHRTRGGFFTRVFRWKPLLYINYYWTLYCDDIIWPPPT